MAIVCGVKIGVQVAPSLEIAAEKTLPARVILSQRGGGVEPALGPSLAVMSPSVVRRRNLALPSVGIIIGACTAFAVSFSRIITPARAKVAPEGAVNALTSATRVPSPASGW